ncbi:hypothetical protein [Flavonifractor sp. An4]|uniref:hypothetical protein n=1 Tax=Flavonifractor sp. An4 TaxID=1965634 RepID=UPI00117B1B9E|nr:hypothetical protein [Flavonifractor sp. An4]
MKEKEDVQFVQFLVWCTWQSANFCTISKVHFFDLRFCFRPELIAAQGLANFFHVKCSLGTPIAIILGQQTRFVCKVRSDLTQEREKEGTLGAGKEVRAL